MTIPHLIHVGLPKTGSVYLRAWFHAHPEITYSERGIAGYGSIMDMVTGVVRTGTPRCLVTSSEQISVPFGRLADGSFDYASFDHMLEARRQCCASLARLFPTAWILVVTRGFETMLRSSYSQYVRTGGEDGFASQIAQDQPVRSAQVWDYDSLVALYRAAFAPGRVIVLPYELLQDNAAAFVQAIETRLGLSHFPPPETVMNRSLSRAELDWYPRMTRALRRLPLPGRVRERVLRLYTRAIFFGRLKPVARLLDRLGSGPEIDHTIPRELLMRVFAGRADTLASEPAFAPYLAEYLIEP